MRGARCRKWGPRCPDDRAVKPDPSATATPPTIALRDQLENQALQELMGSREHKEAQDHKERTLVPVPRQWTKNRTVVTNAHPDHQGRLDHLAQRVMAEYRAKRSTRR